MLTFLAGLGSAVILLPFNTIINALVISSFWGWFLTPVFGTPVPRLIFVIGLAAMVSLLTKKVTSNPKTKDDRPFLEALWTDGIGYMLGRGLVWCIGWILTLFI